MKLSDGLKDKQREQLIAILASCPEIKKVILFGSRAINTYKDRSDIDLAIVGEHITLSQQASLLDQIEHTTIPYHVDLIRYNTITNSALIEHIQRYGKIWLQR